MNTDKKKKLILPAFMAVLCAVMMVGVGYAALTSSFTTTANVTAGDLEVTVNGDAALTLEGKIPYGTDTVRTGTTDEKTYHVDAGIYTLGKDKAIAIKDNTDAFTKYTVSVEVTSDKLNELFGSDYTLTGVVKDKDGNVVTDTEIAKENATDLTLTVELNVTKDKADMDETALANLTGAEVVVKVTVAGVA